MHWLGNGMFWIIFYLKFAHDLMCILKLEGVFRVFDHCWMPLHLHGRPAQRWKVVLDYSDHNDAGSRPLLVDLPLQQLGRQPSHNHRHNDWLEPLSIFTYILEKVWRTK